MKVSTPPSYQDIFPVYVGGSTTLSGYTLPPHRGLFISTTTTSLAGVTVENIDGTTGAIPIIANTSVVLPLVIKKMTIGTAIGNARIYGLL